MRNRAAVRARRRAIETTGSVPVWKDGEIVYERDVLSESEVAGAGE